MGQMLMREVRELSDLFIARPSAGAINEGGNQNQAPTLSEPPSELGFGGQTRRKSHEHFWGPICLGQCHDSRQGYAVRFEQEPFRINTGQRTLKTLYPSPEATTGGPPSGMSRLGAEKGVRE